MGSHPKVVVVDYGIGNVFSVSHALRHAGGVPVLTADHRTIERAERLVLPGVGAFGTAARELRERGLVDPLLAFCGTGRPFLGLCVAMQLLMETSNEFGAHQGLGLIGGTVEKIPSTTTAGLRMRVPHIGWAELLTPHAARRDRWRAGVLSGVEPDRTAFYFVHSYSVRPATQSNILAEVGFGGDRIVAAIEKENLTGVQFHPERSGPAGLKVLRRFLAM